MTEINLLRVGSVPFTIYNCGHWLRYLPCFWHSDKSDYGFPKFPHDILVGAHHANLFSNKIFSLDLVLQILRFVVSF